MDEVTEEDIVELLRGETSMLDTAPSALGFKNTIKDVARMKLVPSVVERI